MPRGSRFPRTSVRHRSSWEVGPQTSGGGSTQTVNGSAAQLAGTAVAILTDGVTLIRSRGEFLLFLRLATAAGDGFTGAFGIAKATAAAVVAGVASVPTPLTEDSWDGWLYHRFFSCISAGPIAVATAAQEALQVNNVSAGVRFEVDSKAMRKADIDESFYAVIEVIEVGTSELTWAFNSRLLFKEM